MIKNFSSVVIGCYPSLFSVACSNEKNSLIIMRMLFWLDYKTYEQTHRNSLLMEHRVTNQKDRQTRELELFGHIVRVGVCP